MLLTTNRQMIFQLQHGGFQGRKGRRSQLSSVLPSSTPGTQAPPVPRPRRESLTALGCPLLASWAACPAKGPLQLCAHGAKAAPLLLVGRGSWEAELAVLSTLPPLRSGDLGDLLATKAIRPGRALQEREEEVTSRCPPSQSRCNRVAAGLAASNRLVP